MSPRYQRLLTHVLGEVMGVGFGLLIMWQCFAIGVHGNANWFLFVVAGALSLLGVCVIHELGHLLAGWAVGLRSLHITIGFVTIGREDGRLRARLNTAWFRPAFYVQPGPAARGFRPDQWAMFVLGGPVSNLLLGVACLVAAAGHNPGPPATVRPTGGWRTVALTYPGDPTTALLNIVGLASLGLGLFNLVPGRAAGWRTDGGQLLDLVRGRPQIVVLSDVARDEAARSRQSTADPAPWDAFREVKWDADAMQLVGRLGEEAAALGDDFLGTPHLFLTAVAALPPEKYVALGLTYESARSAVEATAGPRRPDGSAAGRCQTPRLKRAIERAVRRAELEARTVNSRDLWHSLLADPDAACGLIFDHLGLRVDDLRKVLGC